MHKGSSKSHNTVVQPHRCQITADSPITKQLGICSLVASSRGHVLDDDSLRAHLHISSQGRPRQCYPALSLLAATCAATLYYLYLCPNLPQPACLHQYLYLCSKLAFYISISISAPTYFLAYFMRECHLLIKSTIGTKFVCIYPCWFMISEWSPQKKE